MKVEELERLHDLCLDWDNSPMPDGAETRVPITCGQVRNIIATYRERDSYKAALEEIAAEHDAGRHDGLPEPCPALEDVVMWYIARTALERRGSE